ncbi:MAG: hypothetical protein ACTSRA_18570 [Promethearchaeota archaeon]
MNGMDEPVEFLHGRKIRFGRSVFPVAQRGVYDVFLQYSNKGFTAINNAWISGPLSKNLEILRSSLGYKIINKPSGRYIHWDLNVVKPGENVSIQYRIKEVDENSYVNTIKNNGTTFK